jgi:hypothetical protein
VESEGNQAIRHNQAKFAQSNYTTPHNNNNNNVREKDYRRPLSTFNHRCLQYQADIQRKHLCTTRFNVLEQCTAQAAFTALD